MRKSRLYIIISLMSVSLIGIIWVQVYWIHHGMKVKQTQFDQLVNDALNHVITEIEDGESLHFIHDQLATAHSNIIIEHDSTSTNVKKKITHWSSKSDTSEFANSFDYDISDDKDGKGFAMKIMVNGNTQTIDIEKKLEKLEAIIEKDSLVVSNDENVIISNRFGNMMIKMVKEFKDIKKPVQHLLGSIDIDSILTKNLEDNGITIPFNYAIYHDDELVEQFSSQNFSPDGLVYKVSLFRHNLFDKSAFLALNFNGTRHYILKSMGWMLILSIFFTLFIILTFASTLHYMFKQKKLAAIKNDFINNMTHEFKTPISTISLAIDSITHPKIIEDQSQIKYYANIIRKENKRMNQQVESVLNTALAEKEELSIQSESIAIEEFLQQIESRIELSVADSKTDFKLINQLGAISFNGDRSHLQNAICNLIDNAIKYSDTNPIVNLIVQKNNDFIQFAVSDQGIGMNKETQKLIFDKFYRAQTGNIHDVKGFGIGLSYVKAIVHAHGGQINLSSKPNHGTTVAINLPI